MSSISRPTDSVAQIRIPLLPKTVRVSVVMPCLNEAETLATCIAKARTALEAMGLEYEIVVGDNGSTDSSREIAQAAGAKVVAVRQPGYGAALMGAIEASTG